MKKLINLLQQIDQMDRYKANDFLSKVFGYIALYIILIGIFSCLLAWIVTT